MMAGSKRGEIASSSDLTGVGHSYNTQVPVVRVGATNRYIAGEYRECIAWGGNPQGHGENSRAGVKAVGRPGGSGYNNVCMYGAKSESLVAWVKPNTNPRPA